MTHRAFAQASPALTSPRSPAGTELGTHEATAEPRFWQLICNGAGPGRLVGYTEAAWQAGRDGVTGDLTTGLTWTASSAQDPRLPARQFELRPLTDDEARTWIRRHRSVTTN